MSLPNIAELPQDVVDGIRSELHASTRDLLDFFDYDHLSEGPKRTTSKMFHSMAYTLAALNLDTDRGAELTAGLRHLLEAKDCLVRVQVPKRGD